MHTARPRSAAASGERGFTLIELMVVVAIVGIVAVLAVPSFSSAGYDRRVFLDAAQVGEIVREARTRAVGRGAAELLAMTTNPNGASSATFILYESVTSSNVPVSSCNSPTAWPGSGTTPTSTLVDEYQFVGGSSLEGTGNIIARITDPTGTIVADGTTLYLCFTPNGRAVYQDGASTTYQFLPLAAAGGLNSVVVELTRNAFPTTIYPNDVGSTDLIRSVVISPTGATRITSQ